MSQLDVYNYLKKKGGWVTSEEISKKTKILRVTVYAYLKRLKKHDMVESKSAGKGNLLLWRAKR
ncbi:MAG: helix-turn-helix domain-containing protein [Candidatus Bathyarchaeia archaeon]